MKTLTRVERHVIKPTDKRYAQIASICHKSKNLYNYANYILRQAFITDKKLPKEYDLTKLLAKENQVDYRSLPAQTSQQVIKLLYKNYKSFFKALKSYRKDKSKFTSNPKLPKYKKKDGYSITIFTSQTCKLKDDGKIYFPKSTGLKAIKSKVSNLKQVRFIPKATCFIVEIVHDIEQKITETIANSFISIDLGLDNFVTAIDSQSLKPFIINGKAIKSFNRYYNKQKAYYQSICKKSNDKFNTKRLSKLSMARNERINDFIHKASSYILEFVKNHKIQNVIVGYNKDWKRGIDLGKKNNQNFVSIPYQSFIDKLAYKCENFGINLILTEESYTSKVDHLANESLSNRYNYLGKRVKRGLFKSSVGKYLNADINGAIGIARKVFRDAVKTLADSGTAFVPIKMNLVK